MKSTMSVPIRFLPSRGPLLHARTRWPGAPRPHRHLRRLLLGLFVPRLTPLEPKLWDEVNGRQRMAFPGFVGIGDLMQAASQVRMWCLNRQVVRREGIE